MIKVVIEGTAEALLEFSKAKYRYDRIWGLKEQPSIVIYQLVSKLEYFLSIHRIKTRKYPEEKNPVLYRKVKV